MIVCSTHFETNDLHVQFDYLISWTTNVHKITGPWLLSLQVVGFLGLILFYNSFFTLNHLGLQAYR